MFDRCTLKICHLLADVVCIFVFFQILMWATWSWWWWWWQDALSPVLSLTDVCGSWQTPLSWSHHLSLWARDSAQSSRARVTSRYSHHIVRFTTHPARKSDNLNRSPRAAKALPLSTIDQQLIRWGNLVSNYFLLTIRIYIEEIDIAKGKTPPRHWIFWPWVNWQSTPLAQKRSFNKLWNLGQISSWCCLAKGEKYIEHLWQIHVKTLTNPSSNFYKSMKNLNKSM